MPVKKKSVATQLICSLSCSFDLKICHYKDGIPIGFAFQEMGMASGKSRKSLAFVFNYLIIRVRLPFHAFTYSTSNSGSRENVQNPNQNRNQILKSVRDQCKARAFRNLDHALHLFDTMLHMRPLDRKSVV